MRIKKVLTDLETAEKIFKKHGIRKAEIEEGIFEGNPRFFKAKNKRYLAITHKHQYLTIVFGYSKPNAIVKTAYRSSDWQIRRYKRK